MKHIIESIIGKRGSASQEAPKLRNHDIVLMNDGRYFIVIMDENEMKLSKMTFFGNQTTKGILLRYDAGLKHPWSWQPLNEYDKDLKLDASLRSAFKKNIGSLDIMSVWRSADQIRTVYRINFEHCCLGSLLADRVNNGYGGYKLIWKR